MNTPKREQRPRRCYWRRRTAAATAAAAAAAAVFRVSCVCLKNKKSSICYGGDRTPRRASVCAPARWLFCCRHYCCCAAIPCWAIAASAPTAAAAAAAAAAFVCCCCVLLLSLSPARVGKLGWVRCCAQRCHACILTQK